MKRESYFVACLGAWGFFADDAKLGEAAERIADYYSRMGEQTKSHEVSKYFGQWTDGAAAMGAQVGLAQSFAKAGDEPNTTAAINDLIADFNDQPAFAEAAFDVASQCFYKHNYAQAMRLWNLAYGREHLLERHHQEIPYLLATCHKRTGNRETAIEYYKQALDKYPQSQYSYRAAYRIGLACRELGQFEEAVYWLDEQRKRYSDPLHSRRALMQKAIVCYWDLKDYQKGVDVLQQYTGDYPGEDRTCVAYRLMAKCYEKLGDRAQAIAVLEEALDEFAGTKRETQISNELAEMREGDAK